MQVSVSPELERLILEHAHSLGYTTADDYLRVVFGSSPPDSPTPLSNDAFSRLLEDLSSEENLPSLPADFSRADLYADHD